MDYPICERSKKVFDCTRIDVVKLTKKIKNKKKKLPFVENQSCTENLVKQLR